MDNIRMNMAIAVPQLFYDQIARVLPGFLFIFMMQILLNISLNGKDFQLTNMWLNSPDSFWGSLYIGIAYFICSYYMGWILGIISNIKPFCKYSVDNRIKIYSDDALKVDKYPLNKKYQKIRLVNENAGFRIVKLRAEAKMLEASRTGMCIMTVLMYLLFIHNFGYERLLYFKIFCTYNIIEQSLTFLIPLIMTFIFENAIERSVRFYTNNVEVHYDLMFNEE